MAIPLIIGAAIAVGSSVAGAISARNRRQKAEALAKDYEKQLKSKEDRRQEIIDPSDQVKDLSYMITNPFANLQVATQAAEMQAEEADIALATSLDTLTQTGAGAGGATALAMAALRSKQGIAASIEQQEAQNTRLRAQGEQQMQGMMMQEAGRVQGARMQGTQFAFGMQEQRDIQQLDRLAAMMGNQQQSANQYAMAQQQAIMSGAGAAAGGLMGAGAAPHFSTTKKNKVPTKTPQQAYYNPGCFTKGTLIEMFNGVLKAINEIKKGDVVRTSNNKRGIVKNAITHNVDKVITIWKSGSAGVNDLHPVIINNKWDYSRNLPWDKEEKHVDKLYNLEIVSENDETYKVDGKLIASGKI